MRVVIGILLVILGVGTMVLGGIGLTIYYAYDLIINWETLSRIDIFWSVVGIIFRDVIAVIVGMLLFITGGLIAD